MFTMFFPLCIICGIESMREVLARFTSVALRAAVFINGANGLAQMKLGNWLLPLPA